MARDAWSESPFPTSCYLVEIEVAEHGRDYAPYTKAISSLKKQLLGGETRYFGLQPPKPPRRYGLARLSRSILRTFSGRTTFGPRLVSPSVALSLANSPVLWVAKKACTSPVLICKAMPAICPRELIVPVASIRNSGESAGIRVLRSIITPFCQRKARPFSSTSNDPPTTWPLLLMPSPLLATSPGSVPRSVRTSF